MKTYGLKFRVRTTVEKYPSEEARLRGDPPEVSIRETDHEISEAEALMMGFTRRDIEEAQNGNFTGDA